MPRYNPAPIESKWQTFWDKNKTFATPEMPAGNKLYVLDMFPYPSGDRLHVGHWYNFAPADTYARYVRMRGKDVLSPMGFDAFGLPAENYAVKTGVRPATSIGENVQNMIRQLRRIGCSCLPGPGTLHAAWRV